MIDHFQKLHDDIPPYRQEQEEIYDAYQKYKAAGNPLLWMTALGKGNRIYKR